MVAIGPLSAEEVARYRGDGFLVPDYRLSADDVAFLQTETMRVVNDNPQLTNLPIPAPHVSSFAQYGIKTSGALMRMATLPDILDMMEQVAGPDLVLWATTIFHKPSGTGKATPWHRDGEFWPIEPLATTSIWIAVNECRADNGCLRVIPGSHHAEELGRHYDSSDPELIFERTLDRSEFDESTALDVELEPGQMVLFDVRMIHGATRNEGQRPRTGFSARYMPATSYFDHDGARLPRKPEGFSLKTRPLFLVRGINREPRNDFRRNHPDAA